MVIKEMAALWKADKKQYVKESTYSAYALLVINHIDPYFGEKTEFVESDVQAFVLQSLKQGLSEKTVKDIVVVIKMIQKFAVKKGFIQLRPFDVVYPKSSKKTELAVMAKEDQKKLFEFAKANFSFRNLGLLLCLSTGLRIGEVCGLRWSDIDPEDGTIRVQRTVQRLYKVDGPTRHTEIVVAQPKTRESNRVIPLSGELLHIVKPLLKVVNRDFFILSNEETPLEPRIYRNYYKRTIKRLGIPYLKFHGLRHSFATRCIESKNSVKTVSVILGHSNITTTMNLYVHPDNKEKKRCIERMLKDIL